MSWLRGMIMAVLTAAIVAFGFGYVNFVNSIQDSVPAPLVREGDAIVALTGGGPARLEKAMSLLQEGRGRRLLISGVNREVADADIYALLEGPKELIACCVDLGRQAEDTLGNASETAHWATRNGFTQLIVVTDDYHMPRSLAELRLAMPEVELIPYPVQTPMSKRGAWQRDARIAARIGAEYVKYIVIQFRETFLTPKPPKAPGQAAA